MKSHKNTKTLTHINTSAGNISIYVCMTSAQLNRHSLLYQPLSDIYWQLDIPQHRITTDKQCPKPNNPTLNTR